MVANKKGGERNTSMKQSQDGASDKKSKREPLPMKLRALPQSFWQQPNSTCSIFAPAYPLPLEREDAGSSTQSLVIGAPNTDLLFSLFKGLPTQEKDGRRPAARRGRPRKKIEDALATKEDDPYVTSVAAPEVKMQQQYIADSRKVLTLMALHTSDDGTALQSKFAQHLNELVVNL